MTDLQTSASPLAYLPELLPDHIYLGWDWAQAELYLLCLFSQDANLRTALYSTDVHRYVISMMYGIPMDQVTEKQRDLAKILSYALIYSGFDVESTLSIVMKKAKELTKEQVTEALNRYIAAFQDLFEWTGRALLDWHDSNGWVSYFMGQRKQILYPDYLKREEGALRRSTPGRTAINTYGQNSVGLLLKAYLSQVYRTPFLRQNLTQHLPLFDACTHLCRTENLLEVQDHLSWLAQPLLRHNGFEVQMKADWKASLVSWGDMVKIDSPVATRDPWLLTWDSQPMQPTDRPIADTSINPFALA